MRRSILLVGLLTSACAMTPTPELEAAAASDAAALSTRQYAEQVKVRGGLAELHDRESHELALIARDQHDAFAIADMPEHAMQVPRRRKPRFDEPTGHVGDRLGIRGPREIASTDSSHAA